MKSSPPHFPVHLTFLFSTSLSVSPKTLPSLYSVQALPRTDGLTFSGFALPFTTSSQPLHDPHSVPPSRRTSPTSYPRLSVRLPPPPQNPPCTGGPLLSLNHPLVTPPEWRGDSRKPPVNSQGTREHKTEAPPAQETCSTVKGVSKGLQTQQPNGINK